MIFLLSIALTRLRVPFYDWNIHFFRISSFRWLGIDWCFFSSFFRISFVVRVIVGFFFWSVILAKNRWFSPWRRLFIFLIRQWNNGILRQLIPFVIPSLIICKILESLFLRTGLFLGRSFHPLTRIRRLRFDFLFRLILWSYRGFIIVKRVIFCLVQQKLISLKSVKNLLINNVRSCFFVLSLLLIPSKVL